MNTYSYAKNNSGSNGDRTDSSGDILGNIGRIFSSLNNRLEVDVRAHLRSVYGTLAVSIGVAVLGGIVNSLLGLYQYYFLFSLGIFGLMMAIVMTPSIKSNENKRLGYLAGLAFLMGCTTGPLVEIIGIDDPGIVYSAALITFIVFGSFTLAALYAESTKFLHLGGMLMSGLLCLLIASFFNSAAIHPFILYGGLVINCGFVLYDTQLIAEKRRYGDTDYIWHTVMLLIDFVNIFRHVLVILKEKNDRDKRRR